MQFLQIDRTSKDQLWPTGRSGHRMCADHNFLYVFGGYNPKKDNAIYNELWRYNISSNTWMRLPDKDIMAPKAGASLSMIYWKKKLFTFGGTGYPFAKTNSSRLSMYCLSALRWYDMNKLAMDKSFMTGRDEPEIKVRQCGCMDTMNSPPEPKYGQSLAVLDGKLYIFAGTSGSEFENDLHSFCLEKLVWTQHDFCSMHREFVPLPRYRHESITHGNKFYVLGGATSIRIYSFSHLQYFDYKTKVWDQFECTSQSKHDGHGGFPEPRQSHLCVRHGSKVYLVGGLTIPTGSLSDIWSFDLDTKEWKREKDDFPYAIFFHSGAITPYGSVYTYGGTNQYGRRLDDLHCAQMNVLPLKRQAWLRVAKALQNNNMLNRDCLKKLGVPKYFSEWVDDASTIQAAA